MTAASLTYLWRGGSSFNAGADRAFSAGSISAGSILPPPPR